MASSAFFQHSYALFSLETTRAFAQIQRCCFPVHAVVLGPVKALTYVFTHGLVAATLGVTWTCRMGWGTGICFGALVRSDQGFSHNFPICQLLSWLQRC